MTEYDYRNRHAPGNSQGMARYIQYVNMFPKSCIYDVNLEEIARFFRFITWIPLI